MPPDPHTSGYVGVIPGILLWLLFAWISRAQTKRISKTEEKALNLFTVATIFLVMLPIHLMIGLLVVGVPVLASPVIETITGFDVKAFVRAHIWVDGQLFASIVWTALIGALPSFVALRIEKRKEQRHEP
jgi:preprotein translocase subunit YajC